MKKYGVTIRLLGEPKGKGRPRFSRRSGHTYTPAQTRAYEENLAYAAQMAMNGRDLMDGPLRAIVRAEFFVPRSWSRRKQNEALSGLIRPTSRPDADNLIKTLDALNKIVFEDDAQIVEATISKHYSEKPQLIIQIDPI